MVVIGGLLAALFVLPGIAFAYDETTSTIPPGGMTPENCGGCHDPWSSSITSPDDNARIGVHGGYTATTSKCEECHSVHAAPATGSALLPGATVKATCFTCHDGTSGGGVYGTIAARGASVGASHTVGVGATNIIPGGDANTGGSTGPIAFSETDGTLTCTDCHTPHGSRMVAAFLGERRRTSAFSLSTNRSSKLLKKLPGNATTETTVYGSDWCLGCHKGRDSGLATTHNHPVESASTWTTETARFNYSNVVRVNGSTVTTGALAQNHGGYLMPFPRPAQQIGHLPICQQCHEDARNVGTLSSDGTTTSPNPFITNSPDGLPTTGVNNPQFRNFPHETQNYRMLVEATTTAYTDDLCINCHTGTQLP